MIVLSPVLIGVTIPTCVLLTKRLLIKMMKDIPGLEERTLSKITLKYVFTIAVATPGQGLGRLLMKLVAFISMENMF